MKASIAEEYALTMTAAWAEMDARIQRLERVVHAEGASAEAVFIAGELREARLPLTRAEADAGTFASAYDLGVRDERGRAERESRVTALYAVPDPITA